MRVDSLKECPVEIIITRKITHQQQENRLGVFFSWCISGGNEFSEGKLEPLSGLFGTALWKEESCYRSTIFRQCMLPVVIDNELPVAF